ncbi:MAG: DUF3885 domain-containing protein [Shimia sp.]|nr:DUF3885 domain-containing protein [Shimia sp.]
MLWLTLAAELGIRPRLTTDVYFVDFDHNLVLNPYDDRGMDVADVTKEALRPAFRDFGLWILEWNRPEIQAHFET